MTRSVRTLLGLGLVLLLGGCSDPSGASEPGTTGTPQESASRTSTSPEQLIAQPPQGWIQIGASSLAGMRSAEYVPEGETAENWTRRIRIEALAEKPLPDPIEFIEVLTLDQDRVCGTFEALPTFSGFENGYPTSVSLLLCHRHRDTEQSEISMIKAIQGNDYFYVISRMQVGPPIVADADVADADVTDADVADADPADTDPGSASEVITEEVIGGWAVYLKSVSVCDPTRPEHPCP